MSANNYILVKELKKQFKITMNDADTGVQLGKVDYVKTLREAVNRAQARCDWEEEEVEYGISFDLK